MYFELSKGLDFPTKCVWKCEAPVKACFFFWVATKGKNAPENTLERRCFSSSSSYPMHFDEENWWIISLFIASILYA